MTTAAPVLTAAACRAFAAFDPRLGLRLARAAVDRGDSSARQVLAELLTDHGECLEADELLATMIAEIPATVPPLSTPASTPSGPGTSPTDWVTRPEPTPCCRPPSGTRPR